MKIRKHDKLKLGGLVTALLLMVSLSAHAQTSTTVSSEAQLQSALAAANNGGGNRTILLSDGTYTLSDTLYVNAPNITIGSVSGARDKVIIQGDAMSASARIGNVIRVAASNFVIRDVTLQKAGWHLIQVAGESDADAPIVRNCILRDAYEQLLKVTMGSTFSDNGVVENSLFEYSAGIGPQYYIGGIDAHGAKNWIVRGNTFRSIASPDTDVAEFAVHFWDGSTGNIVERNVMINNDRGIGFGMQGRGASGGVIRNNMIYHANNNHPYADTGIALLESPNTQVYNNTIYYENSFPWTIEYRFTATTNALIVNNLTNKPIQARDGATATLGNNVTNASASYFTAPASGNLHLASKVSGVVDSGRTVSGLTDDFDGQARSGTIDIGADELMGAVPMPPTNVTVK